MLATYEEFYMTIYKILEKDFAVELSDCKKLQVVKDLSEVNDNEPMFIGGDILRSEVRDRLTFQKPTIYIHRGYLGNHLYKRRRWWRASVNGFANTKLMPVPHPRWNLLHLPKHPWKVTEIKKVLIAPSKMTSIVWSPNIDWISNIVDKFPGAEVKIRPKGPKPGIRWSTLWEDLDWADLVVSQASAITAEAFWYGKKVISLFPCPTWAAGCESTLDNWQDPAEPVLRNQWHEHLAWSQFTNEEWRSGEAFDLIEKYLGPVASYNPEYIYNFNNSSIT
jgi:hypothetical protein